MPLLEAVGRRARVTFDGSAIRIHRDAGTTTTVPTHDIVRVEFNPSTPTSLGSIRFVRTGDLTYAAGAAMTREQTRVFFVEWREGGFARLRDAVEDALLLFR